MPMSSEFHARHHVGERRVGRIPQTEDLDRLAGQQPASRACNTRGLTDAYGILLGHVPAGANRHDSPAARPDSGPP